MEENVNVEVNQGVASSRFDEENSGDIPQSMNLSSLALDNIKQTSKWTMFLSIMGFVSCGLVLLVAIGIGLMGSLIPYGVGFPALFSLIYVGVAVLQFFPAFYLYNFSKKAKLAINEVNEDHLEQSFIELKKSFRFVGVMMIVTLCLYAIMFVIGIFGAIASF